MNTGPARNLLDEERRDEALGRAFDMADQLDTAAAMNREKTLLAMREYGGSFVKALADAALKADAANYRRLKDAFPEFWEQYGSIV